MITEDMVELVISLLQKIHKYTDSRFIDIDDKGILFSTGCGGSSKRQQIKYFTIEKDHDSLYANVKTLVEESTDFSRYTKHTEFYTFDNERIEYIGSAVSVFVEYGEIIKAIKELTNIEISEDELRMIVLTYKKTLRIGKEEKEQLEKIIDDQKKKIEEEEERVKSKEEKIAKLEILAGLRELNDKEKILVGSNYSDKEVIIMNGAVKIFENKYIMVFEKDDAAKKLFMIRSKEIIPNPFYIVRDDNKDLLKMMKEYGNRLSIMEVEAIMYRYKDIS